MSERYYEFSPENDLGDKAIVLQSQVKFDEASTQFLTENLADFCQYVDNEPEIHSLRLTVTPEESSKIPVRLSVAEARRPDAIGKTVILKGWVRTRRDSKAGFSFIELNDGSCFGNVQILAPNTLKNYADDVLRLGAGWSVRVVGLVKKSPSEGQPTEVIATEIEVYGAAGANYPLQKKRHSLEFLRTIAHLRPRTNTFGAVERIRNRVSYSIHQFFQERGFFYVHTPLITASDCEGAGQMFRVTTLDPADPPRTDEGNVDYSRDFFGKSSYLTVSGQLEAETFACGLGKVYTFGPTFRAENSNTTRHLAEFWMIEPEAAFYELEENMELAEGLLKRIFQDVLTYCAEDMAFFNRQFDNTLIETLRHIIRSEFVRLTYTEAIDILEKSGRKFDFPVSWGVDLQSEHERYLTEEHFKKPVILYNYPRTIKPFYMRVNDDGKTVRAMDVLVPKIGEIIGGSEREYRLDVLEERMNELHLKAEDYEWYTDLRRFGTVPHSGFGLGFERVILFVTGIANIRDVIPFPRTPGNCEF
ncbi:MAG: asparagine--tRNA ligase [Thermoguttaceae bacterium]|nr:asparagine--tRNA ligase [Thermoguttaceae bacterium]